MGSATTPRVRTVAVVGHPGSGKTTLVEALLHRAGVVTRAGSVEDGSTVSDHEPEEVAHGMSLGLGIAPLSWRVESGHAGPGGPGDEYDLTLLDAPGHPDFGGAVDAALTAADLVLVVVSAVDGVQAGTRSAWARAAEAGLPRMVVVTKEDKARADFRTVLAQLREAFGEGIVPLELPLGEEQAFRTIADVLAERSMSYDGEGHHTNGAIAPEALAEEHALHDEVTEEIVSHDDEQLERYLSGESPDAAALEKALVHEVADLEAFPVLAASGTTGVGVDRLADLLCVLGPSARPRTVTVGTHEVQVTADPDGETLVHVFRTVADPFVGQVSVFKMLSGTLRPGDRLTSRPSGTVERMHGLFLVRGKAHLPVDKVVAGQVAAVAKLTGTTTGSLLTAGAISPRAAAAPERPAVYARTLLPVSQSDDDRLSPALARLVAEDPTLRLDHTGGRTVLRGLGDTHLQVAVERLARVFGVHVTTEPVPVAYRETVARAVDAEGRLKKQSGGHGQFAVVQLKVSPLPRGSGLEFVDKVVGGAVPRTYLPAVERGISEAMAGGGPQGHPVVDLRVEVVDGKAHAVDSSDMAFRTAASLGLREALNRAGTVLLEPVAAVTVDVPAHCQGDVLGDLSARRGRILGSSTLDGDRVRIDAEVPQAELDTYVLDLRSLTGGRAELQIAPLRHEPVPSNVTVR